MPSLRTFHIEFDRPGATYAPGEVVTGNVIVDLTREKTIRALKLSIKGEANVSWENRRIIEDSERRYHIKVNHFRASEQYFYLTHYLLGQTGHGKVRMPVGFHKYPFNFPLPYHIPCSFEHADGHIRYTTKAVIDRPWRFDHECKIAFSVVSSYDLNAHSQQCLGIDDEVDNDFSFCFFKMGSMKVRIRIPMTGFVPGQSIETMVNFNNNSTINVTKISVQLERKLEFLAKELESHTKELELPVKELEFLVKVLAIPAKELEFHAKKLESDAKKPEFPARSLCNTTKMDEAIVKVEQSLGPFGQIADVISRLQIPPIPPSDLHYCSIIDQKYNLRVTIHVSGMHCNITKIYPILIGTIPLRSMVSSAPYTQDMPQPTAPAMEYDYDPPPMPTSPDYAPSNVPYPRRPIGFASLSQPSTSANQWNIPPPSYEECMQRTDSIKDHDEPNYVYGANEPFAPRYPVFNFSTPYPPRK